MWGKMSRRSATPPRRSSRVETFDAQDRSLGRDEALRRGKRHRNANRICARVCGGLSHLGAADAALLALSTDASPTANAATHRRTCRKIPTNTTQAYFNADVIAIMDALKIDRAHVVGHSMGASTALHVGIRHAHRCVSVTAAGCGYGSSADPKVVEESARRLAGNRQDVRREHDGGARLRNTATAPTRQAHKNKDPRGYAAFVKMLSEHSPLGHSLIMANLQAKRPTCGRWRPI